MKRFASILFFVSSLAMPSIGCMEEVCFPECEEFDEDISLGAMLYLADYSYNQGLDADFSADDNSMIEGKSTAFGVTIQPASIGKATVTVSSDRPDLLSFEPSRFVLDTGAVSATAKGMIQSEHDLDSQNDLINIYLAVNGRRIKTYPFSLYDDESNNILISDIVSELPEGTESDFYISLKYKPTEDVEVYISGDADTCLGIAPAVLVFTENNYDAPQKVDISALEDSNALDEVVHVDIQSTGLVPERFSIVVVDDEGSYIKTSTIPSNISETSTSYFEVSLFQSPVNPVTVYLDIDSDSVALSPASLEFDSSSYNIPQIVTIVSSADTDSEDNEATLTLSATGLDTLEFPLYIIDDENNSIEFFTVPAALDEGESRSFSLKLVNRPTEDFTLRLASSDISALQISPTTIAFDDTNWNTKQTVTLLAKSDSDVNDEAVTVSFVSDLFPDQSLSFYIVDYDDNTLIIDRNWSRLQEGEEKTFRVKLFQKPLDTITVNLLSSTTDVTVSPSVLSFTADNYGDYRTITVKSIVDADAADEEATITLQATGLAEQTVFLTVEDQDSVAIASSSFPDFINESNSYAVYLSLSSDPGKTVQVNCESNDGAISLSPPSFTFDSGTYETPQPLLLSAVSDADASDEHVGILCTGSGVDPLSATVKTKDDDTQSIVLSSLPTTLGEGNTDTFYVKLGGDPGEEITVSVASSSVLSATVSTDTLTFDSSNWGDTQSVIVRAEQDANNSNEIIMISLTAPGIASESFVFDVLDND